LEKFKLKLKNEDEGTITVNEDGTVMICPPGNSSEEVCIVSKDVKAKETALEYFRLFGFSVEEERIDKSSENSLQLETKEGKENGIT